MSAEERCILLARVFKTAFDRTESWLDDDIGAYLAYLAWAVVDSPHDVHSIKNSSKVCMHVRTPVRKLLEDNFKPEDPVWLFITS